MKLFCLVLILALLFAGCAPLSQTEAEGIAQEFVDQNVKFFAREEGEPQTIEGVNPPALSSYREGKLWVVIVHISSEINGTTKQGDLVVKIDQRGEVVEFNGKKLE